MADYGTDVSTYLLNDDGVPDLDPQFALIDGERVVAEQVLRAWETPRGSLVWYRSVGGSLPHMLGKRTSTTSLLEKRGELAAQAEAHDAVFAADVELDATGDTELTASGDITTAEGTFRLVAQVSDVTVDLLSPE